MFGIIKKNYFLLASIFLIIYFFFNFLDGERGLFSYFKKNDLLLNLKDKEIKLTNKIENLDYKNLLLTKNIDLDFIEILIREKLIDNNDNENKT